MLGIESSCDDTGVALLRASDGAILGEAVVGQTEVHAQWGGVVPTLAMEAHKRAIDAAVDEVLRQAGLPVQRVGACAATVGPGLSMCLQVRSLLHRGAFATPQLSCLHEVRAKGKPSVSQGQAKCKPRAALLQLLPGTAGRRQAWLLVPDEM